MVDARGESAHGSDIIREVPGYRIERQLGRGSTGVVYLAEDVQLRRKVALKVLAPTLVDGELFRKRFDRESHNAANLDHPNIIPVYTAGEAEGALYIAMRYVSGGDLRELLEATGPLSLQQASAMIAAVAEALDAVHAHGMVHRDVKPANILIDGRGGQEHYYLSDFGISKIASLGGSLTSTGQIVGTIDYISPEQVQAKPVDGRADLYALGCVLYHCLTGTVPFPREDLAALMWAHVHETPPPVTALRPDLPPHIDHIVASTMAKQPQDRYPTCRELALALHALAADPATLATSGKVVPAPPLDSPAPPPTPASMTSTYAPLTPMPARAPVTAPAPGRTWWWLAAGGVVVLALIAGSTVAVQNYRSSRFPSEAEPAAKLTIPEPTQASPLPLSPAPGIPRSESEASDIPPRASEIPAAPRRAPEMPAPGPAPKAQDTAPQPAQTTNAPIIAPSNPISPPTTDSSPTRISSAPPAPPAKLDSLDGPAPGRPGPRQDGSPQLGTGGCAPPASEYYRCYVPLGAPGYLPGTRAPDGHLSAGNYQLFRCQSPGGKYSVRSHTNRWWAWWQDSGDGVWIPVIFLAGSHDDGPEPGLPMCGSPSTTTTTPPTTTITPSPAATTNSEPAGS
ncbi:MAG: protein kinase domain-containing protein [Pseudonocardiaceae bacterium]